MFLVFLIRNFKCWSEEPQQINSILLCGQPEKNRHYFGLNCFQGLLLAINFNWFKPRDLMLLVAYLMLPNSQFHRLVSSNSAIALCLPETQQHGQAGGWDPKKEWVKNILDPLYVTVITLWGAAGMMVAGRHPLLQTCSQGARTFWTRMLLLTLSNSECESGCCHLKLWEQRAGSSCVLVLGFVLQGPDLCWALLCTLYICCQLVLELFVFSVA